MVKVMKAKKVYTLGTHPASQKMSPGRGRPRKIKSKSKAGLSRK